MSGVSSSYSATYPSDVSELCWSPLMINWNNCIQECDFLNSAYKGPAFHTAGENKTKLWSSFPYVWIFPRALWPQWLWNRRHFDAPGLMPSLRWSMSVKVRIEDEWMQLDIKKIFEDLGSDSPFGTTMFQMYIQDNMAWYTCWEIMSLAWLKPHKTFVQRH